MMKSWLKVKSFGGANTVTGSAHMITVTIDGYDYCYLIDCGLFQGQIARKHPELNFNLRNYVYDINAVFITHAHIDHVGRVPALYRWGYRGPVYATKPVCELSRIMLEDSAKIQLEETVSSFKKELSKKMRGEPYREVELLYDLEDAREVMGQFETVERDKEIIINEHLTVIFYDAGHGLGSSSIKMIFSNGKETFSILFSGDLGNKSNPILKEVNNPYITGVDAVFVETTYAGRFHASQEENWNEIREKMAYTLANGGKVILPAFAVGRTQEILYILLNDMMENDDWVSKSFKETTVYVDSLLAVAATNIFKGFPDEFKTKVKEYMLQKGKNPFEFSNLQMVYAKEESIQLSSKKEPCIILSAAGMCDAGRVIYHLRDTLDREDSLIVFTGYQGDGTLGRRLLDGEKFVNVAKKHCEVRAKICELNTLSAHADQNGIISWLNNIEPGYMLFLIHGEEEKQSRLKTLLGSFGIFSTVECLELNTEYELNYDGFEKKSEEFIDEVPVKVPKNLRRKDIKCITELYDQLDQIKEEAECKHLVSEIKREIKSIVFKSRGNFFKDKTKIYKKIK